MNTHWAKYSGKIVENTLEKPIGKRLSKKQIWIFAIGQLGWSILGGIVNAWLVTFYFPTGDDIAAGAIQYIPTGHIFWVLTVLGIITAASRLFDAVTDPLIASLSDRCKSKRGRRIPFMQWSAVPFAAVAVLLFCAPDKFISSGNIAWISVFVILFYLFMTMYCTPYNALISEFGKTQEDRMAISTAISLTFFVGTLLSYVPFVLAAPIRGALSMDDAFSWGYRIPFIALAVIALVAMLIPTFLLKEKEFVDAEPSKSNMFKSLASTFKNKDFRIFVGSDIMYWIGLTLFQTGLPFFVKVSMQLNEMMVMVLMGVMTVLSAAVYPFVTKLVKKFGKKNLVIIGFFGLAVAYVVAGLTNLPGIASIPAIGYIMGFAICLIAAFPMALLGIIPQSIVADVAEAEAVTTGENREGMFFAARTFSMKLGQSIAMLAFTSLAIIGSTQDTKSNDITANTLGLGIVAIVAIVFCVLGAVVLFFYREKKIMKIIAKDSDAEFLAAVEKASAFDKFSKEEGESVEPAPEQSEQPAEEVAEEPVEPVEEPAPEEEKPEE